MHRAARIAGLVWMALTAMGALLLYIRLDSSLILVNDIRRAYGFIALVFFVFAPGALLYRWGRGPYRAYPSTRENLRRAYPPKTAEEMGHVLPIKPD